jgi:hypothetical protein
MAAANTCTSSTGTAAGTDPNFTVTYKASEGKNVFFYVKYTKGANNLTITYDAINKSLHATDKYRMVQVAADGSVAVLTHTLTATGNHRLCIPKVPAETTLVANVTFAGAAGADTAVCNFMEE